MMPALPFKNVPAVLGPGERVSHHPYRQGGLLMALKAVQLPQQFRKLLERQPRVVFVGGA